MESILRLRSALAASNVAAVIAIAGALLAYRLLLLAVYDRPMHPDEAYYAEFARNLDFGYYSKPPLVAGLMAAAQALLPGEWLPRAMSGACFTLAGLCLYGIGRELYDARTGLIASLVFLTLPVTGFLSGFMTTDAPLLALWAGALLAFTIACRRKRAQAWLLCGLLAGLGLQSKYSMGVFALCAAATLLLEPRYRTQLRGAAPWLGVLIAAAVFAPNVWWNWRNQFVSFSHTAEVSKFGTHGLDPLAALTFLAEQILLIGPLMALLLPFALWRAVRGAYGTGGSMLAHFTWPVLLVVAVNALFGQAHLNWALPAYVAASVLVAACTRTRSVLLAAVLATNLVQGQIIDHIDAIAPIAGKALSYRVDPYRDTRGWRDFARAFEQIWAAQPYALPIVCDDRKTLAELRFYAPRASASARFVSPRTDIGNHYQLVADLRGAARPQRYLALVKHLSEDYLEQRFAAVSYVTSVELRTHTDHHIQYRLYVVDHGVAALPGRSSGAHENPAG